MIGRAPAWVAWLQRRQVFRCGVGGLDDDLASGYVRVLQEMIAAGWFNSAVATEVLALLQAWFDLAAQRRRAHQAARGRVIATRQDRPLLSAVR